MTALIAEGANGIGFSLARAFLNASVYVIITGRSKDKLSSTIQELSKGGGNVKGYVLDNTRVDAFEKVFMEIIEEFKQIDTWLIMQEYLVP